VTLLGEEKGKQTSRCRETGPLFKAIKENLGLKEGKWGKSVLMRNGSTGGQKGKGSLCARNARRGPGCKKLSRKEGIGEIKGRDQVSGQQERKAQGKVERRLNIERKFLEANMKGCGDRPGRGS